MTMIFGFAGNKLLGKNKSTDRSLKVGVIATVILLGVKVLIIRYF